MADINKTIKQLEADIDRAKRTGEILVYVGRATARDCLELLKEQKEKIEKYEDVIFGFGLDLSEKFKQIMSKDNKEVNADMREDGD